MAIKKQTARANTPAHKRRIVLYLPTKQMMDQWQKAAEKSEMTTSAFIQNIVNTYFENGVTKTAQHQYEKQLKESIESLKQLRQENIELSKQVTMLNTVIERYEDELRRLRNKDFLDNKTFTDERKYKKELIELLQSKKHIKEHEVLDLLHIDPTDSETVKAISAQIENLLDYGFIKLYRGGYLWQESQIKN
ncbi:MAG: hypothetical protein QCI00_08790 [Candidatus Thermoplasmatota archaeon]|nr:hypothetical protein [Candidatus Thermoplasmatota archaeon]